MQPVTLNEILTAVRELTFDRFVIPAFALKQTPGMTFSVIPTTEVNIVEQTEEEIAYGKISFAQDGVVRTEISFEDTKDLETLMHKLIEADIVVAYTPYFMGSESVDSLIKVTDRDLSLENCSVFRRYFFSDNEIVEMIKYYYSRVLRIELSEVTDEIISKLKRPSERHLVLWVSYHLVDRRRLYENAANAISQSFTDGSDYVGSGTDGVGSSTTVQIGSVFSITEDPTRGFFYEDFNRVGSDNVWGDRYSFWFKLMVYLRNLLEQQFGDYSLRPNMVIPGVVELQRELDFRSYYDSYPFTISPLSRGILSKTP